MPIVANNTSFVTLADVINANNVQVSEVYANNVKVYPSLPDYIKVTTPPTKTTYYDGETIDYTGIEVTAYCEPDVVYGAVPYNELIFPVTTAVYSTAKHATLDRNVLPHFDPILYTNLPFSYIPVEDIRWTGIYNSGVNESWRSVIYDDFIGNECYAFIEINRERTHYTPWIASKEPFSGYTHTWNSSGHYAHQIRLNHATYRVGSETRDVYYASITGSGYVSMYYSMNVEPCQGHHADYYISDIAYVILYGDVVEDGVPVEWPRPGDSQVLSDSVKLVVVPAN